jgi:hypothetical protein
MRGLQPPAVSTPGLPSFNSKAPDARPVGTIRMRGDWVAATVGTAVAFCSAYWPMAQVLRVEHCRVDGCSGG